MSSRSGRVTLASEARQCCTMATWSFMAAANIIVSRIGSREGSCGVWWERYARRAERSPASHMSYISSPNSAFNLVSKVLDSVRG